jgi:hypothetical protein
MREQEVKLLKKQMAKLDDADFDLGAWKTGAIIILERIFGPDNQKIFQMEKIRYDQSSWALREAKGSKNMMDTCKKQGQEILEIAIEELEQLGLPKETGSLPTESLQKVLVQSLENELKISQYKEVVRIVQADKKTTDKKKELIDMLNKCGHDVGENILASILLSDESKNCL